MNNIKKNYVSFIIAKWYFPLYDLDLRIKNVDKEDLIEIQKNWNYS